MLRPRRRAAPVTSTVRPLAARGLAAGGAGGRGGWGGVNEVERTSGRTMQAVSQGPDSLTTALQQHIRQAIAAAGGWIGFDRFMELALYTPGLGYYANDSAKFGSSPASGSDFVT